MSEPTCGEVWWVDLEPTVGSEANKVRPAIVVSSARFDRLNTRVVVPLTYWSDRFQLQPNKVRLVPDETNHLEVASAADAAHVRSVSVRRFVEPIGTVSAETLEAVYLALDVVFRRLPRRLA